MVDGLVVVAFVVIVLGTCVLFLDDVIEVLIKLTMFGCLVFALLMAVLPVALVGAFFLWVITWLFGC